jgi:hypothetical protein
MQRTLLSVGVSATPSTAPAPLQSAFHSLLSIPVHSLRLVSSSASAMTFSSAKQQTEHFIQRRERILSTHPFAARWLRQSGSAHSLLAEAELNDARRAQDNSSSPLHGSYSMTARVVCVLCVYVCMSVGMWACVSLCFNVCVCVCVCHVCVCVCVCALLAWASLLPSGSVAVAMALLLSLFPRSFPLHILFEPHPFCYRVTCVV